jgi:hypothetical protein
MSGKTKQESRIFVLLKIKDDFIFGNRYIQYRAEPVLLKVYGPQELNPRN